jgi:hypothetical protein
VTLLDYKPEQKMPRQGDHPDAPTEIAPCAHAGWCRAPLFPTQIWVSERTAWLTLMIRSGSEKRLNSKINLPIFRIFVIGRRALSGAFDGISDERRRKGGSAALMLFWRSIQR